LIARFYVPKPSEDDEPGDTQSKGADPQATA
jgi:hypothetical protein